MGTGAALERYSATYGNFQFKGPLPFSANVDPSLYPVYVRPGSGDFYDGVNFRYNGVQVAGRPAWRPPGQQRLQ